MSDPITTLEPEAADPKVIGMLAEFTGPAELTAGARAIREKGYCKVEAFSPFPIHGIDEALAAPKPMLPWVVLAAGLTGCAVAILMQWYMNAFEAPIPFSGYEYRISGKPYWSLPANIPVTFELIILFASFTAFLGMIAFNKLPRFSNPLFKNDRFLKATDDGFFLLVEADDPQFAADGVTMAFQEIGAAHVEPLYDIPDEPLPGFLLPVAGVLAVVALVPLVYIASVRGMPSETPRLSIWWDMDYQPKAKAQSMFPVFADGREMRMPVDGTVARGGLKLDSRLQLGIQPEGEETFDTILQDTEGGSPEESGEGGSPPGAPSEDTPPAEETDPGETGEEDAAKDVAASEDAGEDASEEPQEPEPPWVTEVPAEIQVNKYTLQRGQNRFNIYCSVCHGLSGDGDGLVAQRALDLQQLTTWTPPTSLHLTTVRDQPIGRIYHTMTKGRNKMAGYEEQISLEDRWAVALYVKALQKSRNAKPDELTDQERAALQ